MGESLAVVVDEFEAEFVGGAVKMKRQRWGDFCGFLGIRRRMWRVGFANGGLGIGRRAGFGKKGANLFGVALFERGLSTFGFVGP